MSSNRDAAAAYALERSGSAVQSKPTTVEPPTDYDFKSFVLYVHESSKRGPLCLNALSELSNNAAMKKDTLIQDLESLPLVPSWLDSVPCLVVKSERRAFKDDACIKFIHEYRHKGAVGYRTSKLSTGHKKAVWGDI